MFADVCILSVVAFMFLVSSYFEIIMFYCVLLLRMSFVPFTTQHISGVTCPLLFSLNESNQDLVGNWRCV